MRKKKKRVYKTTKHYIYAIILLDTWSGNQIKVEVIARSKKDGIVKAKEYAHVTKRMPENVVVIQVDKIGTKYL